MLDDLIIVPHGFLAAVKLIPAPIMADLRERAAENQRPKSIASLLAVLLLWVAAIWFLWASTLASSFSQPRIRNP